jgi:hypothetical protein
MVARLLNFFPKSKNQTARAQGARAEVEPSQHLGLDAFGLSACQSTTVEHLFSRHVAGVGAVKSLGSSSVDRGAGAHAFPQNSENFFLTERARGAHRLRKIAAKLRVGGRSGAEMTRKMR